MRKSISYEDFSSNRKMLIYWNKFKEQFIKLHAHRDHTYIKNMASEKNNWKKIYNMVSIFILGLQNYRDFICLL